MKKKLIILLVLTTFILFGLSSGCKKKFDITGTWTLNFTWQATSLSPASSTIGSVTGIRSGVSGSAMTIGTWTFSGDISSGTFVDQWGDTGTYTVNGNNVTWKYTSYNTTYVGVSSDKNSMSGTMVNDHGHGTWSATR